MIKIEKSPVVARIINRRTCFTLILTNAAKIPFQIFSAIFRLSFTTKWANDYDIISVHPLDGNSLQVLKDLEPFISFTKIEEYYDN